MNLQHSTWPAGPSRRNRYCHRALPGLALACAAMLANAHDTWFEPLAAGPDEVRLALGTGSRFPQHESGIGVEYLVRHGCRGAAGPDTPLQREANAPTALIVRAALPAAMTCWAQLAPFEIELPPDKVRVYLKDINAPAAVRQAWAAMQARGVAWKERYTKHARIELCAAPAALAEPAGAASVAVAPVGMGMDVLLAGGAQALHPGDPLVFQVLREGRPLPGLAVELRSELSPLGIWRQTDAEGRVRLPAPLPGRWVLRGTDLRLSGTEPERWESRFVTLAFEVLPALR